MPILAYVIAKIFAMPEPETLALLFLGSSPGGSTSNLASFYVNGDMDLRFGYFYVYKKYIMSETL